MTAVYDERAVEVATEDDLRNAVRAALAPLQMTYEALATEAATRRFSSDRAHRVWLAIAGLGDFA